MPSYKVEIGFESTVALSNFFTLNSATKGKLNNPTYVLGGGGFYVDVTEYFRSIFIGRGKSRQLDRFNSGQLSVEFTNTDRIFDPTYAASPFYGEIVPKRKIRIWMDNTLAFVGIIDDWDLSYNISGQSLATANASDGFVVLANRTLTPTTSTAQLSGARVSAVLNDPTVAWPVIERDIDAGKYTLGADIIGENTNALSYLQTIETSETGNLFIGKNGYVNFQEKYATGIITDIKFADDGTGISYGNLDVSYGSELLYNEVNATSIITGNTSTHSDTVSQAAYGILTLDLADLLLSTDAETLGVATYLVSRYSSPEFRFESMSINMANLTPAQEAQLIDLELGDIVQVVFTPNGIAPAIDKFAEVVRINHDVDINSHIMTIGFGTLPTVPFRLDSSLFGKLDINTLG